jgi:outer membrane protein OmpA-like peptidoglycan-associated protein
MKFFYHLISFLFFAFPVSAQEKQVEQNIVPNPSFERYSGIPLGWFYKGKHFSDVMKYWNAPTSASPDIFGPKVRIPNHWAEKGFGKQPPRTGNTMVGITLYGCEEGKPHCREYLQIQLKEPLVIGQLYYFECWTKPLPRSLRINNIGALFSVKEINTPTDELLEQQPAVNATELIRPSYNDWTKVAGKFKATEASNYLIIGNFFRDATTKMQRSASNSLNYAYYYIYDVLLKKEQPILEVPITKDDLSNISLEEGKIVILKNIFFETDKYELLPRSFIELNKLLQLMQENPNIVVEVRGHTDIRGKHNYNKYLSRKRAKAVVLFLIENGIHPARTHYRGFGSSQPIAGNETSNGMQLNRRVEFKILSNKVAE